MSNNRTTMAATILLFAGFLVSASAAEPGSATGQSKIRASVERGLTILQRAATNYPTHRKCFSCHHQTLPILAMKSAQSAGITISRKVLVTQNAFARKSFRGDIGKLKSGKRVGGDVATVTYGLWMFSLLAEKPDELSAAMVTYLLKRQKANGSWKLPSSRPPMMETSTPFTVLAIDGLRTLADPSQSDAVKTAIDKADIWLAKTKSRTTEDLVMQLWLNQRRGEEDEASKALREKLLKSQHENGGWSQNDKMKSDAYATGQAVYALLYAGDSPKSVAVKNGIAYLLKTQKPDGSWFVKKRARPVQTFFDNGDPHGKSQFISIAATAWATAALAVSFEKLQ